MKMNRPVADILDEVSDLNMASFYRGEFLAWRGGDVKFTTGEGDYMCVARFAQRRGFVGPRVHASKMSQPLSQKGRELLGMDARQNRGRWAMLVEMLKEMGK